MKHTTEEGLERLDERRCADCNTDLVFRKPHLSGMAYYKCLECGRSFILPSKYDTGDDDE